MANDPEETVEELARLSRRLNAIVDRIDASVFEQPATTVRLGSSGAIVEQARRAYADRRRRSAIFGDDLFGEPAWDILLDLFTASHDGGRVSVTSACIGSAVPPTTGLRWLTTLEEKGLVEREIDPRDQRRALVRLTDRAIAMMETYFGQGEYREAGLSKQRALPSGTPGQNLRRSG